MHLDFLYTAVSWVLLRWHQLLTTLGMDPDRGLTWALSIVALVVTARLLLVRVFLRQVHSQRAVQRLQPEIAALRKRHGHDRAELNRRVLALQRREGLNPLAAFAPMLLQLPVFLGLYHVLKHLANSAALCHGAASNHLLGIYSFSAGMHGETCSAARATLSGAPLAASFRDGAGRIHALGGSVTATHLVIVALLVGSAVATLLTQLLARRSATSAPEGSAATVQRLVLWVVPVGVLLSGLLFKIPLGVLLYWFISNVWTLGQQVWIARFHPPTPVPTTAPSTAGRTATRKKVRS